MRKKQKRTQRTRIRRKTPNTIPTHFQILTNHLARAMNAAIAIQKPTLRKA